MKETQQPEVVRVLELDYEMTTKLVEGLVSNSFTIRGWGIALISALIGLTFQAQRWEIAVLAIIVTILIAFVDGYHASLYAKVFRHAQNVEHVLSLYYSLLARGEDDPDAGRDYEVAIGAHKFGRFAEVRKFRFVNLRDARPRLVIIVLYATLLLCALVSGSLVFFADKNPSKNVTWTTIVEPSSSNALTITNVVGANRMTFTPVNFPKSATTMQALLMELTNIQSAIMNLSALNLTNVSIATNTFAPLVGELQQIERVITDSVAFNLTNVSITTNTFAPLVSELQQIERVITNSVALKKTEQIVSPADIQQFLSALTNIQNAISNAADKPLATNSVQAHETGLFIGIGHREIKSK